MDPMDVERECVACAEDMVDGRTCQQCGLFMCSGCLSMRAKLWANRSISIVASDGICTTDGVSLPCGLGGCSEPMPIDSDALLQVAKIPYETLLRDWKAAYSGSDAIVAGWRYGLRANIDAMYTIADTLSDWVRAALFRDTIGDLRTTGAPSTWDDLQRAHDEVQTPTILRAAEVNNWTAVLQLLGHSIPRYHLLATLKGWTLLHISSRYAQPNVIAAILDAMKAADCFDIIIDRPIPGLMRTALFIAAEVGADSIVQLLIDVGADMWVLDTQGLTPLMGAVMCEQSAVVTTILRACTDESIVRMERIRSHDGWGAIALASFQKGPDTLNAILHELYHRGVNTLDIVNQEFNIVNKFRTSLSLASEAGRIKNVETLLAYGADILTVDSQNKTALFIASARGRAGVVSALTREILGYQPSPDVLAAIKQTLSTRDQGGWTTLHAAAHSGHHRTVRYLLSVARKVMPPHEFRAFVNARHDGHGQHGRTPLHMASECLHADVVQSFAAYTEVDFNLIDAHGNTAISLAKFRGARCTQLDAHRFIISYI